MGEVTEANAAVVDTGGYDYKRLHSYPLIRVELLHHEMCLTVFKQSSY